MKALPRLSASRRRALWLVLAALTLLSATLHTVALFTAMDEIGYFQSSAVSVILFSVLCGLGILCCVAFFFLINNKDVVREPRSLPMPRFIGTAAAALATCVTALFLIFRTSALPTPTPFNLLVALALLCATVYFALRLGARTTTTTVLWGYGAILSAALSLVLTYFDRYTQMNAPHKLAFHVCMLAVMFALLLEQRDLLGRPLSRLCAGCTALATFLCTVFSLPAIIAFVGGVYDDPFYLFFDILTFGFAAYFGTKCVQYARFSAPDEEVTHERL